MTDTEDHVGRLIRAWRQHTDPESVGFVAGTRRVPGLRREELAALAGVSVDYIVRIEQGRARRPSGDILIAIARALRLEQAQVDALHRSAGMTPPGDVIPDTVSPGVERLLARSEDRPVAAYTAHWWLLRWNPLFAALMGDPAALRGRDRNLVWREFAGADSRVVRDAENRHRFRQALVADLRLLSVDHATDSGLRRLVRDLRNGSAEFERLWDAAPVARHQSERKRIAHPGVGELVLDCDVLRVAGTDINLVMYSTDPQSQDATRLNLLAVLGNQTFFESAPDTH